MLYVLIEPIDISIGNSAYITIYVVVVVYNALSCRAE